MTFAELWQESLARQRQPGAQQSWLRAQLPRALAESRLRAATKHSQVSDRVVVGSAEYVRDEMLLLDQMCAAAASPVFEVFFLTTCASQADVHAYVPIDGPVHQSPVVGVWKNGRLEATASGATARQLLQELVLSRPRSG